MTLQAMDGMTAAAHAAYALSDAAIIFPITPASHMAETVESWAAENHLNFFDAPVVVEEMQSEKGVAGTIHGCLAGGALTSTFTASQGLMLMIPTMYKLAGELLPAVFHVTCRSLSGHALSIFGDHQDVMAVRPTGFAMLASTSVQECMDLSWIAHLSAIEGSLPFVHFFDGFRTSDEVETVETVDREAAKTLVNWDKIHAFRARCLEPTRPHVRGTAQNPDVYFQNMEARNSFYNTLPAIVQSNMDRLARLTGRSYHLFDYVGHPQAEQIIVAMASACDVIEEAITYLNGQGAKYGLVKVRLYRPFDTDALMKAIPPSATMLCALDRTKEPGAQGEPLFQDLCSALVTSGRSVKVIGGRFGLSSKDFTPTMVKAVFDNMSSSHPLTPFTVGITDDVTHLSLPLGKPLSTIDPSVKQCVFYGFGSDGTVGANREAAKIISDYGGLYSQCYSWFDSKKSGGLTISYVRFGPKPIRSPYLIQEADYLACHKDRYIHRGYEMAQCLKPGGIFVLNSEWTSEQMEAELPALLKRCLASKRARFFNINATYLAESLGLGNRISTIMTAVFFKLSQVMDFDTAIAHLKEDVRTLYGSQGDDVVTLNLKAIDAALESLEEVPLGDTWASAEEVPEEPLTVIPALTGIVASTNTPSPSTHFLNTPSHEAGDVNDTPANPYALTDSYLQEVFDPISQLKGNDLPVSALDPGGITPLGTSAYERRTVAFEIPEWNATKCIQCFQCSFVCPHASIRPYLATDEELAGAPKTFDTKVPILQPLKGLHLRIQVYPEDCVGCGSCADNCPAPDKALIMKSLASQIKAQKANLAFARTHLTIKDDLMPATSVAGTQLRQPLLEFSGACAGCGETPHVKLLTQLFGDRLVIANATGCSSIWGAYSPSMPYTTNRFGHGPAWANSLFEDNAEYGFGIARAIRIRRKKLVGLVVSALNRSDVPGALRSLLSSWILAKNDPHKSFSLGERITAFIRESGLLEDPSADTSADNSSGANTPTDADPLSTTETSFDNGSFDEGSESSSDEPSLKTILRDIDRHRELFGKKSVWSVGGDGWAYDIDYDGLDAVLAKGENLNVLVLDTEGYSNTGGEESKATELGSVSGFSLEGKQTPRKRLGQMMMQYGYVYVAQVCLGANMQQVIDALREAEAYDGPSIVIALCPCISWGIKGGMATNIAECKRLVKAGYWPLFRFNPERAAEGKDPLTIDSQAPDGSLGSLLDNENRFSALSQRLPKLAQRLHSELAKEVDREFTELSRTVGVYEPSS